jgi:hypothetical protein
MGNSTTQDHWEDQEQEVKRPPEGCNTDLRNRRMEETSWGERRVDVTFEGRQGSRVPPYMDGVMMMMMMMMMMMRRMRISMASTLEA